MSIPSSVLMSEIKQQGFSAVPYKNELGEICIGFGHRLMQDPQLLNDYDDDLASAVILYDKTGLYEVCKNDNEYSCIDYQDKIEKYVLECGLQIDMETASAFLEQDIINYYEVLVQKSSGFRRLINLCHNAYCLPNTQMSKSLEKFEKTKSKKNGLKNVKNPSKGKEILCGNSRQEADFFKDTYKNDLQQANSSNTNNSFKNMPLSNGSNSSNSSNSSKTNWEILKMPNGSGDSALIRIDTLIMLAHILGVERVLKMRSVFASLRLDDYRGAAGYLLSHSNSETLKSKMVLLSRRIHYGIMICDIHDPLPLESID